MVEVVVGVEVVLLDVVVEVVVLLVSAAAWKSLVLNLTIFDFTQGRI